MIVAVNYWLIGIVVVAAILLIFWLVKRNHQDQKTLEKEIIKSELKPEKHDDPTDKTISP